MTIGLAIAHRKASSATTAAEEVVVDKADLEQAETAITHASSAVSQVSKQFRLPWKAG